MKKNGCYAVNGLYHVAQKGKEVIENNEPLLLSSKQDQGIRTKPSSTPIY